MKKISIPVSGVREATQAPGPVTTWAQMSPEKQAELRALYENRPAKPVTGIKIPEKKKFRLKLRNRSAHGKKARTMLSLVVKKTAPAPGV